MKSPRLTQDESGVNRSVSPRNRKLGVVRTGARPRGGVKPQPKSATRKPPSTTQPNTPTVEHDEAEVVLSKEEMCQIGRRSVSEADFRRLHSERASGDAPSVRRLTRRNTEIMSRQNIKQIFDNETLFDDFFESLDSVLFEYASTHHTNLPQPSVMESAETLVKLMNSKRLARRSLSLAADANLGQMKRRELAVRLMEVQCGIRSEFVNSVSLAVVRESVDAAIAFLGQLEALAKQLGVGMGPLFQELLGRGKGIKRSFPSMAEYPVGIVPVQNVLSEDETSRFVHDAIKMCDLVRVKLADENDLKTGAAILFDTRNFFESLEVFAAGMNLSLWEACEELTRILYDSRT